MMMSIEPKIGILWRGDRSTRPAMPDESRRGLESLFEAFQKLPVSIEPVLFEDDAADSVREQLLELDGVLV